MYDWPELQAATDRFWEAVAAASRARAAERVEDAPWLSDFFCDLADMLERTRPSERVWRCERLLLSQCCGAQAGTTLADAISVIAAPSYNAQGCGGGTYSSVLIVRRGAEPDALAALAARPFAVNGFESHSGWWCLVDLDLKPTRPVPTGSHRASCRAVAESGADAAAIDAVAWAHFQRFEPETAEALSPIAWTRAYPAPPFITARRRGSAVALLRAALTDAVALAPDAAASLLLSGVVPATAADYGDYARLAARVASADDRGSPWFKD